DTIEDNELSNVEYKVKGLYSLMDHAKIIINKHTKMPNAINSIDKNFNYLQKMVDNCERFDRKQKIQNT
ncbi:23400_t:CDS:1, partial [Gigaspora margarita]